MSTNWSYQCHTHTPPIWSDDSINHGETELLQLLELWHAGKLPTNPYPADMVEVSVTISDRAWPWYFLRGHPHCDVRIVSEYGDEYRRNTTTGEPETIPKPKGP